MLLCGLSVVLALFFYVSYRDSSAAVIAIISCAVAPVFVLLSSQELLENIVFQAAFLAFFVFSLVPLLVVGLDLVFCLPGKVFNYIYSTTIIRIAAIKFCPVILTIIFIFDSFISFGF